MFVRANNSQQEQRANGKEEQQAQINSGHAFGSRFELARHTALPPSDDEDESNGVASGAISEEESDDVAVCKGGSDPSLGRP